MSAVTGGVAGAVLLGAAGGAAGFISGSVTGAIGAAINGEDVFDGFANCALFGTVVGGISGALSVFAPGIGGTGAAVLANTGSIALTAGKVAAGVVVASYLFASNERPRNNSVQNKQFRAAAREAGYDVNNPSILDELFEVHKYIRRKNLNPGFKELVELIKDFLG